MKLWEILVPKCWNNGLKIAISYHRQWDKKVRQISGGLTILRSARGQWVSPTGRLYKEQMIPVRIYCNDKQLQKIIEITLEHYSDQEVIMAYLISTKVIMKKRCCVRRR